MIYNSPFLAFLTLVFVSILIFIIYFINRKKNKGFVLLGLQQVQPGFIAKLVRYFGPVLTLVAFIYILFALARPQEKILEQKTSQEGVDILFVLDISQSMLIEDMLPLENRLESAKFHIKEFIQKRPSDRMGLVVFSGEAYTKVPLTLDHGLLLTSLQNTQISDYIKQGTAIGVALAAGVNRVRESKSKSRVIVLLTDGENNTGVIDPLTALDLTVESGARVYTIGIGRDGQSKLPVFARDRFGNKVKTYRPFPTKINEKLLTEIATKTSGQFYRASSENDMGRIFSDIDKLEKNEFKLPDTYQVVEKFQNPLKYAVAILILLALLDLAFWRGVS